MRREHAIANPERNISRARDHHAIKKGRFIISDLLPSGSSQHVSEDELNEQIRSGGRHMRGAKVVFIAHKEAYVKRDKDGSNETHTHGESDGLSNIVHNEGVSPSGGHWLEAGGGFNPNKRRHDWKDAPYRY